MDGSAIISRQIYGFAVGGMGRLLYSLKNVNCCYLVFPNNLNMYMEMLIHDQPQYILGLGSYSGADLNRISIETICSNQFRNNFVEGNKYTETEIKSFIKPMTTMEYAKTIGNSYCNQTSWKIMQLINQCKLRSQYTFLHIPKIMKSWLISQEIDRALLNFRKT
jgi:pyrrolidone-carboxylate peptidase